jgi:hypothetical protein
VAAALPSVNGAVDGQSVRTSDGVVVPEALVPPMVVLLEQPIDAAVPVPTPPGVELSVGLSELFGDVVMPGVELRLPVVPELRPLSVVVEFRPLALVDEPRLLLVPMPVLVLVLLVPLAPAPAEPVPPVPCA